MAEINRMLFYRHLRAEPSQYILHYRRGRLVRQGVGLAYWFHPLSAAVTQVPVEDIETTFVLREWSADFQEIMVQITLIYRIMDAEKAARRINFSLSLENGAWVEQPLERLENMWARWAQQPTRSCLAALPLVDGVRLGADHIRQAVEETLQGNPEIEGMGLAVVSVQVDRVAPTAELEKALQTPTREAIQQKADEATFQRRAMAVEKERAIKENELETEIKLACQQEELIRQEGANEMLAATQQAEQQKFTIEADVERNTIVAQGYAEQTRIRTEADNEARRMRLEVETEAEARRVALWREVPPSVALGLAAQQFAGKVERIEHLNLTPNLLGDLLQQMLMGQE
ncbi:MAG: band 7 protein [Anaerolineae bacterium]|nr:band 7 protein [Anaerolineae bacterium]